MGLRFRKSITLCKGVRVNFGKTGASLSVGGKGYRKTFHTSGKVTTSVGLPGTGIYWTETENRNKKRNTRKRQENVAKNEDNDIVDTYDSTTGLTDTNVNNDFNNLNNDLSDYSDLFNSSEEKNSELEITSTHEKKSDNFSYNIGSVNKESVTTTNSQALNQDTNVSSVNEESRNLNKKNYDIFVNEINQLYKNCDENIDWTEILFSSSADEVYMNEEVWSYCRSEADLVLDGDADTYLRVIEKLEPVSDLLLYAGDFEFGTNSSTVMEVEFTTSISDLKLVDSINEELINEYYAAVSIRVARDIFALLPVSNVVIYLNVDSKKNIEYSFDRKELIKIDYKKYPMPTGFLRSIEK